jgi:hypothetical protein
MDKDFNDINTVCFECGEKHGKHKAGICTVYIATCDICQKETECTEIRDFGYLKVDDRRRFEI